MHGSVTRSVPVLNYGRLPVTYAVTCDAPFVSGPATITVPGATPHFGAQLLSSRSAGAGAAEGSDASGAAAVPHQHPGVRPGVYSYELTYAPSAAGGLLPLPSELQASAPAPNVLLAGYGVLAFAEIAPAPPANSSAAAAAAAAAPPQLLQNGRAVVSRSDGCVHPLPPCRADTHAPPLFRAVVLAGAAGRAARPCRRHHADGRRAPGEQWGGRRGGGRGEEGPAPSSLDPASPLLPPAPFCPPQAVVADLTLHNPRPVPVRLDVSVAGPGLSGPASITLPPNSDAVYEVRQRMGGGRGRLINGEGDPARLALIAAAPRPRSSSTRLSFRRPAGTCRSRYQRRGR